MAQGFLGDIKKLACQIGRAPFARAGVLVELPKRIPMFRLDLIAGEGFNRTAKILRLQTFFADVLALARTERCEKAIEISIAVVLPMELLAFARHQPQFFCRRCLGLGAKGDV